MLFFKVLVRVGDSTTTPFTMRTAHSTLLMLGNKVGGVFVECRTSNSETLVTLTQYRRGNAPVQLINHSKHFMIEYSEKDNQGRSFLAPGESVYYTWVKPLADRVLVWSLSGQPEEHENQLLTDDRGVVPVGPNRFLSWVSFLDGMQRILVRDQVVIKMCLRPRGHGFMSDPKFFLSPREPPILI